MGVIGQSGLDTGPVARAQARGNGRPMAGSAGIEAVILRRTGLSDAASDGGGTTPSPGAPDDPSLRPMGVGDDHMRAARMAEGWTAFDALPRLAQITPPDPEETDA